VLTSNRPTAVLNSDLGWVVVISDPPKEVFSGPLVVTDLRSCFAAIDFGRAY